jgi:hypothetical protein
VRVKFLRITDVALEDFLKHPLAPGLHSTDCPPDLKIVDAKWSGTTKELLLIVESKTFDEVAYQDMKYGNLPSLMITFSYKPPDETKET